MSEASTVVPATPAIPKMSVIDLGEHSHKRIKKLRKGEGRLMDKVEEAVSALGTQGVIDKSSNVVIVLVREEPWSLFKD